MATKIEMYRAISSGNVFLGIELGSTRIKVAVMTQEYTLAAEGSHTWQSSLADGYWTYSLEEVQEGLRAAFADARENIRKKYGVSLTRVKALGVSAMMHGYLAFDEAGNLLVPFRTWQNTTTEEAAKALSELFGLNIPQRWSIAHLYQAIRNREEHVARIASLTTLAGYVHRKLTGRNVLGIGDASGMFPIDPDTLGYDKEMMGRFNMLAFENGFTSTLESLLPEIALAGEDAGTLTAEGAAWLDPAGSLQPGAVCCPPEGDAGTGMTATNAVLPGTGNVSAGTSIFSMVVLSGNPKTPHPEIDMVTTPDGKPVAMVHCNNCTDDMNAWADFFGDVLAAADAEKNPYELMYEKAAEGEPDCGGLTVCNYTVGEPITGISDGTPLLARDRKARFTLANLSRAILYSAAATLKLGNDILLREGVHFDRITGHGGYFKNGTLSAEILASALHSPVSLMENAQVGGPYGCALLAAYCTEKAPGESLAAFLENRVFSSTEVVTVQPDPATEEGFEAYMERFRKLLQAEKALEA